MSEAAKKSRPQFSNIHVTQLMHYRLPLAGVVSILHRISGALMFLLLPFVLYLLERSITSEISFDYLRGFASQWYIKLIILALSTRWLDLGPSRTTTQRRSPDLDPIGAVMLAVAVLIVVLIVWGVFFSPLFSVRSLQVEGLSLTDQGAAEEALQPLEGKSMTRISSEEVESLLTQFPAVASVDTSASGSGTLRVEVQERIPVAAVEDGDGWQLVDREGTQLEQLTDSEQIQVPVIAGGTDVLGSEDWDTVSSVLASLPSSLLAQVQTARAESGGVVMLELQDGVTVRWGDDTDSALKAEVLAELVDASEATGEVEVYDVSAPRHPVLE